ncbi:MAG TPA: hypothetical protein VFE85_08130 [Woeseiaceae bacterium]|nr:hypothetical protein [Woeseiaceae bacterium]
MKSFLKSVFAVTLLLAFHTAAACDYPARTEIPNGTTATKEEMITGQKAVKEFVANMETYLDCLLEEERAARAQIEDLAPEDEQLRDDLLNKKYNAAVDEMEKVAAQFNEEVQAYKARDN